MATATRRRSRPADAAFPAVPLLPEELKLLETWHPNVLISGPREAVGSTLDALAGLFRAPIVAWHGGGPLAPDAFAAAATLILDDASALTAADQHALHAWLCTPGRTTQVVTTTSERLLPLVEAGRFDAALYYALNVIYFELFDRGGERIVGPPTD